MAGRDWQVGTCNHNTLLTHARTWAPTYCCNLSSSFFPITLRSFHQSFLRDKYSLSSNTETKEWRCRTIIGQAHTLFKINKESITSCKVPEKRKLGLKCLHEDKKRNRRYYGLVVLQVWPLDQQQQQPTGTC